MDTKEIKVNGIKISKIKNKFFATINGKKVIADLNTLERMCRNGTKK